MLVSNFKLHIVSMSDDSDVYAIDIKKASVVHKTKEHELEIYVPTKIEPFVFSENEYNFFYVPTDTTDGSVHRLSTDIDEIIKLYEAIGI